MGEEVGRESHARTRDDATFRLLSARHNPTQLGRVVIRRSTTTIASTASTAAAPLSSGTATACNGRKLGVAVPEGRRRSRG